MRGEKPRSHQEGNGSRNAPHAVHTPPIASFSSLSSCPDKISQQSHECRRYAFGESPRTNLTHPHGKLPLSIYMQQLYTGTYGEATKESSVNAEGDMAFNIHQSVFSRDGEYMEKAAMRYREQLLQLFVQSPEGKALEEEGIQPGGWADMMMEYGMGYPGVTPAQMSAADLREVLFELFPRKVSALPEVAPEVIRELQAFWQFLQREFHLENAVACLKVLDEKAAERLEKEIGNPANFGIAKSMVMMGMARGFDMSSPEGIEKWMATYNAEIAAGTGQRIPLPGECSASAQQFRDTVKRKMHSTGQSNRSKMQRESQKRNRRKK